MSTLSLEKTKSADEAIRNRVSIRRYTDDPVPVEDILTAVELAGNAPSAFNIQPWRFVAVTDPATKERLKAVAMNQPQVAGAPVVFALVSDMEDAMSRLEDVVHPGLPAEKREASLGYLKSTFGGMSVEQRADWALGQTNIALGYLLVALEAMGYGSSPMLGFDPEGVKEVLGLPPHVKIAALVAFGRPDEEGFPKHRLPAESIVQLL
jgi:nitroreductase